MNKNFSNITFDPDYIINFILPSVIENNIKINKKTDECNSLYDFKELEVCLQFLQDFLDYVIYVLQLYDRKEMKKRIIKLNNIENLLFLHSYLSLFSPPKKNLMKLYWNKNNNNKNYLNYCIVINLAYYLSTYSFFSSKKHE